MVRCPSLGAPSIADQPIKRCSLSPVSASSERPTARAARRVYHTRRRAKDLPTPRTLRVWASPDHVVVMTRWSAPGPRRYRLRIAPQTAFRYTRGLLRLCIEKTILSGLLVFIAFEVPGHSLVQHVETDVHIEAKNLADDASVTISLRKLYRYRFTEGEICQ